MDVDLRFYYFSFKDSSYQRLTLQNADHLHLHDVEVESMYKNERNATIMVSG